MNINRTDSYNSIYPSLALGVAIINGCTFQKKHTFEFKSYKRKILKELRKDNSKTKNNLSKFDDFFKDNDSYFPLNDHLNKTIKQGFPNINIYIDTHIVTEMSHGLLMGIQDYDKFKGSLSLDVAKDGETFEGIGGLVNCKEGEIIVRDEESIVASLLQGPDKKTLISDSTTNVIIYSFMVPDIDLIDIENSLQQSVEILTDHAEANHSETDIV